MYFVEEGKRLIHAGSHKGPGTRPQKVLGQPPLSLSQKNQKIDPWRG